MKTQSFFSILAAIGLAASGSALATTASSDPVGFVTVTVKANSDATIAVPLNRTADFKGAVASIAGSVITVSGTPGWTAGQFDPLATANKTYAVQLATGTKEGMIGKITTNTTNTITVQLDAGDDFTGVVAGDQIDIMPYWTASTLFSSAPATGFLLAGFENSDNGVNFGSSELYVHAGSNVWEDGINGGDATHFPLRFGAALIARNSSGTDYTATFVGSVPMSTFRIRLSTKVANLAQDQYFGYMAPVPEPIATPTNPNALGLPVQTGDLIQGFDNSVTGINQGSAELYVWNGNAWEDGINGGEIHTTAVTLKPGFGYIFQKAATPSPTSVVWTHLPGYLQ